MHFNIIILLIYNGPTKLMKRIFFLKLKDVKQESTDETKNYM